MKRTIAVLVVVAFFATVLSRAVLAAEPAAKTDTAAAKTDAAKTDTAATKADTVKTDAAKTDAKKTDAVKEKAKAKAKAKPKSVVPADRVVVMYFHRTQRCPTCRAMGSFSEEAVKTGFAKLIKQGKVEFHFINFQDEKNDKIVRGYSVKGPTLIVAKVVANKVAKVKNLDEIWTKVNDKAGFLAYVQSNVKSVLK